MSRAFAALVACGRAPRGLRSIVFAGFLCLLVLTGGAFRLASLRSLIFGQGYELDEIARAGGNTKTTIKPSIGRFLPGGDALRATDVRRVLGRATSSHRLEPILHDRPISEILEHDAIPRRC